MALIRSEDIFQPKTVMSDDDWENREKDIEIFDGLIKRKVVSIEQLELNPNPRMSRIFTGAFNEVGQYILRLDIHHDKHIGWEIALFMYERFSDRNFAKTEKEIIQKKERGERFYYLLGKMRYFNYFSDMTLLEWNGNDYEIIIPIEIGSTEPIKVTNSFGLTYYGINSTPIEEFWITYEYSDTPLMLFILRRGKNWSEAHRIIQKLSTKYE